MRWLRSLHRRLLPDDPAIGWTPYLWLVFLSFFFIRYWFVRPTPGEAVAVVVTLAVFLPLYFRGYWVRGWSLIPVIAGIAAIGTAWAPVNVGAGVFFIYAAGLAGSLGPVRRAAFAVSCLAAWTLVVTLAWQRSPIFWLPTLVFGPLVGVVNIYHAGQRRRDAALRLSQQEVRQLARLAERERISRDLHDLLGHTLSVVALKAELAGRLLERDPERAGSEIREVEEVARAALAEVREAVLGMRARGLVGELEHARVALKAAAVELAVAGGVPELPPDREAVLALVLREAVTNVIRHAEASHCAVALRAENAELLLEVRDDGRGGILTGSGGIEGMRERLAAVGGRLEIACEYGTTVRAWLPLEAPAT
jgi:two-component system, NarL family, sensor histidine kinase DesK